MAEKMKVTVFLGSSSGRQDQYGREAGDLGTWLARQGYYLIYGGSGCGTMGVMARAALAAGGEVTGIMPRFLVERGKKFTELGQFILTDNMDDRKHLLMHKGDVIVGLPGGAGTLEEISEAIANRLLGLISSPVLIYSPDGFYEPLRQQYMLMTAQGFVRAEAMAPIAFCSTLEEVEERITARAQAL